jgi:predicted transcriptional regulator
VRILRLTGRAFAIFLACYSMYEVSKREMLWKILKILGVPDNLIEVLKKLYTDVTINLRVGEKLVQSLSTSGVKQGDNLAPVLFIVVMEMRRCR